MRNFINILQEWVIPNIPYGEDDTAGCWITADGEVETCDYDQDLHHADIASQNFEIEDDDDEYNSVAMRNGWIRIRFTHEMFGIELSIDHIAPAALKVIPRLIDGQLKFVADVYKGANHLTHSATSIGSMMGWIRSQAEDQAKV
jgi:hypothetical protein